MAEIGPGGIRAVSGLEDHLGFWLRAVSNHVSQAFARKVAEEGVSVAEWALMRVLYGAEPMAPSAAAQKMGMTRGAITKLADRLTAKGLVRRAPSPADGRGQILALTRKGLALLPDLAGLADRNERECFGHLADETRETLRRTLRDLARQLDLTAIPID